MFVPAIGADPRKTWERQTSNSANLGSRRLDYAIHDRLHPAVQVHLYDHLTPRERSLEVKRHEDPTHQRSAEAYTQAESAVAEYGVRDWADRFLRILTDHRRTQGTDKRPILFITHSTGGIVVKHVLSQKPEGEKTAALCLGITFFATPHHGSSVLSKAEYVQNVKTQLGLKWEMSETLRNDFTLRNIDLDNLNNKFALNVVGLKIYSYVEISDTILRVPTNDTSGETLIPVRECIVDSRSGKLGTPELPYEDEEVIPLNTTHVGAPIFKDEDVLYGYYLEEISAFVKGFSDVERAAYHALNRDIMNGTKVEVHQFYLAGTQGEPGSVKILTAHPSLQKFLEQGPAECMKERVRGEDDIADKGESNGFIQKAMVSRSDPESVAPLLTITNVDTEETSSEASSTNRLLTLAPPFVAPQKSIHTRRPSLDSNVGEEATAKLAPKKPTKTVQFSDDTAHKDVDEFRRPQRAALFPLPGPSSERFKWIHVPFCHSGWVPHVLTTISQERNDPTLHKQLLMDKMWFSQHNRSRHASSHARFVRPMARCLLPKGADKHDGITTPLSANSEIQFAVYLPYLHWDTFKNMQRQAEIIKKRSEQAHARPVIPEIARSKSMAHKLIWQHLTSDRPVHCRRTLDQYGYPSLRNTAVRDADQILYKRTKPKSEAESSQVPPVKEKLSSRSSAGQKRRSDGDDDNDAKVLMVDQLWLWIMDNQTVITFFAAKEKEENDGGLWREGDLRSEIYQDINGDFANQCADPLDFAALAVMHAVKAMFGDGVTDRDLQVFRIFEEYISILTEQQTSSFKYFRNNHRWEKAKDINAAQHIDNRKDLDALLELRDIEDELGTIDRLIKEQQACVMEMELQYKNRALPDKGINGLEFLQVAAQSLKDHLELVDGMLKSAKAAQTAFKELLDMKQKQANIVEAHLAREQNEVAADQSRSVMIFTVFTIIFLPLSFFASVFGINAREWSSQPNNYPSLKNIFMIMIVISLAVIIFALLVAFNKFTRRVTQKAWKHIALPVLKLMQRCHLIKNVPPEERPGAGVHTLDLEKLAMADKERAEMKRLSTKSRTYSKMNWEEELKWHRKNSVVE